MLTFCSSAWLTSTACSHWLLWQRWFVVTFISFLLHELPGPLQVCYLPVHQQLSRIFQFTVWHAAVSCHPLRWPLRRGKYLLQIPGSTHLWCLSYRNPALYLLYTAGERQNTHLSCVPSGLFPSSFSFLWATGCLGEVCLIGRGQCLNLSRVYDHWACNTLCSWCSSPVRSKPLMPPLRLPAGGMVSPCLHQPIWVLQCLCFCAAFPGWLFPLLMTSGSDADRYDTTLV